MKPSSIVLLAVAIFAWGAVVDAHRQVFFAPGGSEASDGDQGHGQSKEHSPTKELETRRRKLKEHGQNKEHAQSKEHKGKTGSKGDAPASDRKAESKSSTERKEPSQSKESKSKTVSKGEAPSNDRKAENKASAERKRREVAGHTTGSEERNQKESKNVRADTHTMRLTRYIHTNDEAGLPWIQAKARVLEERVDGIKRLSNPFEHTCGGNQVRNESLGHDGPSNFISFSNAEKFPEVDNDCLMNWDKGQQRIQKAFKPGRRNRIIDMSTFKKAAKWCYLGGKLKTKEGKTLHFEGASTIKPWPYKCAKSVYQTELQQSWGSPDESWWTPQNRWKVAGKCAEWASLSREVLLLPDPDKILEGDRKNAVLVETDRPRAKKLCAASWVDKCVTFNRSTNQVCCCSDPACGVPCPRAPGV